MKKITVNHIIEDLVAETISNPLLDKSIKETIILELKRIYFKSSILNSIDNIELETRTEEKKEDISLNIEKEIKNIIENRKELKETIDIQHKKIIRTSESFAIIAGITTILASVLTFVGKEKYDNFSKPFYDFLQNNDFYIGIVGSVIAAVVATFALSIFKKINKK